MIFALETLFQVGLVITRDYGYGKSWLGELASKNGGSCKHIQ